MDDIGGEIDENYEFQRAWHGVEGKRMEQVMMSEVLRDRGVDEMEVTVVAVTTPQWVAIRHLLPNQGGARSFSRVDSEIKEML